MFALIFSVVLGILAPATTAMAQYQPCVWPNPCSVKQVVVAQFQPCVWPNPCSMRDSART